MSNMKIATTKQHVKHRVNRTVSMEKVAYLIIIYEKREQNTNDFIGSSHDVSIIKTLQSSLIGDNSS
jgi:hypothetical protein